MALLVLRWNRATCRPFLGCERYPDCTHTEPVPTYFVLVAQGNPILPGFE